MTGHSVVREVERKFRVHALFRLPDLVAAETGVATIEPLPVRELAATYYDTDDLRLFRSRITLRRRTGGDDEGWHLKLPVSASDPGARDEVHLPLSTSPVIGSDDVYPVPIAFIELVTAVTRGAPLRPVARLRTTRTPFLLRDDQGRLIAELVDDSVSIVDGDHVVERFREIEVEARDLPIETLEPIGAALAAEGAVPGEVSKAARALGPAASGPPDIPVPSPVLPVDPAGEAVRALLQRQARALIAEDLRFRRDLPDAIHQIRVAARRLRSGLKVFAPLVEPEWNARVRGELTWIAGELGDARDLEVLSERLHSAASLLGSPHTERIDAVLRPTLDAEALAAQEQARLALSSERYLRLLDLLVEASADPALTEAAGERCRDVLPGMAERSLRRLTKAVRDLDVDGPSQQWHEARIVAKRARYAAEALEPVFGDPARHLAKALKSATELLGEHQDCAVAVDYVETTAAAITSPEVAYSLGVLAGEQRGREHALRRDFRRLWPEVSRVRKATRLG